ncbi:MAG: septation protein A [Rickettsiaceae bacterium]|nr:septation protein A [Rickettsiaceae bacterium]
MFKLITEFGPLIAFFAGYKTGGIISATIYMLIASLVAITVTYIYDRKIHKINIISTVLLLISASLTIFSGNAMFIKMKPTVLYFMFACIFLTTNYKWSPAIKYVLGHSIKLKEVQNWQSLNLRFMWFFFFMSVLNEIIWRNFDESTWVNFKVFGVLPITLVFVMLQIPFIMKNQELDSDEEKAAVK